MDINQTQSVEATTPDATPQAQAEAILREMGEIPGDATTQAQATEPEKDAGPEVLEPAPIDDSDLAEGDDEEEDVPLTDLPTLDEELAKNPVLAQRWEEQQRGVQKLVDRLKTQTTENAQIIEFGNALTDPQRAAEAYELLGRQLAQFHGWQSAPTPSSTDAGQTYGNLSEGWDAAGFDSPGEYLAYQRAKAEMQTEIEALRRMIEPTLAERQQSEQRRAFDSRIDAIAPKVIDKLKAADNGWTVTREMVAKAVEALPQFASTPSQAVRMFYSDDRAKHMAKVASQRTRVPDMAGRGHHPTGNTKPVEQWTAEEVMASMGIKV